MQIITSYRQKLLLLFLFCPLLAAVASAAEKYKFTYTLPEGCSYAYVINKQGQEIASGDMVEAGTDIYFTPMPDSEDAIIESFTFDGKEVTGTESAWAGYLTYSLVMPDHDASVVFTLSVADSYTLNYTRDAVTQDGVVNIYNLSSDGELVYPGGSVSENSRLLVWATPDKGSEVVSVLVNGEPASMMEGTNSSGLRQAYFTMTEDATVEVQFTKPETVLDTFTVNFNYPAHCATEAVQAPLGDRIYSGSEVKEGRYVVFNLSLDPGYYLKSATCNGKLLTSTGNDNTRNIQVTVDEDLEIVFDVEEGQMEPHTLTFRNDYENGILTVYSYAGEQASQIRTGAQLKEGVRVVVLATPDEGSKVKSICLNGDTLALNTQQGSDNADERLAYFDMPNADAEVTVEFTEPAVPVEKYPITYSINPYSSGDRIALLDSYTLNNVPSGTEYKHGRSLTLLAQKGNTDETVSATFNGKMVTLQQLNDSVLYFNFLVTAATDIVVTFSGPDGVAEVHTASPAFSVVSGDGCLTISGQSAGSYVVTDLQGRLVIRGQLRQGAARITLPSGLYVVRVGDETRKVLVR